METRHEHITVNEASVPSIAGTTLKVVEQQPYGWSPRELPFQHPYLTLRQIHSGLAYHWDHRAELDRDVRRRLERVAPYAFDERRPEEIPVVIGPRYSKEEFARRGDEIYERDIVSRFGLDDEGKFVVIDLETGAYEVDRDEIAASDRLLARRPDAQVWLRRVGSRYARRFGQRKRAETTQ